MPRLAVVIEYDGRPFAGWQRQPGQPTVQDHLEESVRRFCGERVRAVGAGRTDSGVHATGQVAHLDIAKPVEPLRLLQAVNSHLRPLPIAILAVRSVEPDFHARFDAKARAYRYLILTRRAPPTAMRGLVWHHPARIDAEIMHQAGQVLIGPHDFTSFRALSCQARSPVKSLDILHVRRAGDTVTIDVRARSFLHHQVRNIVGSLALIGSGRRPAAWLAEVLAARDRTLAGPTAPASGLTLVEVCYPSWSSRKV